MGALSGGGPNTMAAGIVVSVVIIASIAAVGVFQFEYAPKLFASSSTALSTSTGPPAKGTYVNVTIPSGASAPSGAPGFSPDRVTVVIGVNATVWWSNNDAAAHTVTGNGNSPIFNSGNLDSGQSYIFTFTVAGTYTYHCSYHSWMTGTVVVVANRTS